MTTRAVSVRWILVFSILTSCSCGEGVGSDESVTGPGDSVSTDQDVASTTHEDVASTTFDGEADSEFPEPPCPPGSCGGSVQLCTTVEGRRCVAASDYPRCVEGWCEIPAGTFQASRPKSVPYWYEYPEHVVTLTRTFVISETEVTREQWAAVMGSELTVGFASCGPTCPASGITFFDAAQYANALSTLEGRESCYVLDGCDHEPPSQECDELEFLGPDCAGYRLPSAAEWELAAGGGTQECIPGSGVDPELTQHAEINCLGWGEPPPPARYCGNSEVAYTPCQDLTSRLGPACAGPGNVAQFEPNQFGLFDMAGNVLEMTGTLYDWPLTIPPPPIDLGVVIDPGFDLLIASNWRNEGSQTAVTVRGGGFHSLTFGICAFARVGDGLGRDVARFGFHGFRLARTLH